MTIQTTNGSARLFQPGAPISADIIDLGLGYPDLTTMPADALSINSLTAEQRRDALSYGPTSGNAALIDALSRTVTRDITSPRTPLITNGAMEAVMLVLKTITAPGAVLFAEQHTFPGLLTAAADAGLELVAVPTDVDGVDPDALVEVARDLRARGRVVAGLYLMPTASNPTGTCMPCDRRKLVADASARLGIYVIEDDAYRDVFFEGAPPAPIFNFYPELTIHIRSLSKVICAGVRLAVVYGPPNIIDDMTNRRAVGGTSPLASELVANFLNTIDYDSYLANLQTTYRLRRDAALNVLSGGDSLVTAIPSAGFFLWLGLPANVDGTTIYHETIAEGVRVLPAAAFALRPYSDTHIRISYSCAPRDQLERGIEQLIDVVDAHAVTNRDYT